MKKITRYIDQLTNKIIPNSPAQTRACHQVTLPYSSTTLASSSFPSRPGSPTRTDSNSKVSLVTYARRRVGKKLANRRRCLLDMLPDDVLLAIFDFCADEDEHNIGKKGIEAWQTLVHVCRRWRCLVFESPRRLNLRLFFSSRTPARDTLDVWPALPLFIWCRVGLIDAVDNVVAALERNNCVRKIDLDLSSASSSQLETIWGAMQVPFPEMTDLELLSYVITEPVLPDSFLGGSARSLKYLYFSGIPFPGLPKLLLSATHLFDLYLHDIPHSGYLSPDRMVTALSTLTSLGYLRLGFQSPLSRPDPASRRLPPPIHFVLPVLTHIWFKGVSEYLDDLVAHVDAPQLSFLEITFFNQIVFDTPQLIQFISRTPTLNLLDNVHVTFEGRAASVGLESNLFQTFCKIDMIILCKELDWQVSSLEQFLTSCLPPLSTLETLFISAPSGWLPEWKDNIESILWLELLHPFTGVKNLYLSEEFALRFASALQELVGSRTTEVLPALQNLFLEGYELLGPDSIGEFVAARQVTGHPIAVSHWEGLRRRDETLSGDPGTLPPQQRTPPLFKLNNMVSRGRQLINALHL